MKKETTKNRADYVVKLQAPFYTVGEIAELLDFSWRTIQRRIKSGELKASRIGNRYRITREDLIAFLESTKI